MENKLTAILTGDIVNSREVVPALWQNNLKEVLNEYGSTPGKWEIFRGDMFQLQIRPEEALLAALKIKAQIKQDKQLDVRIAIGIGQQEYKSGKISESNGEAYTNSGHCFDHLKKKRLAIKTPWNEFDKEWNLHLMLASLTMDDWSPKTSFILKTALDHPEFNQQYLADILERTQSTISESLNRAGYHEIDMMLEKFREQIKTIQ